ncbi:MAG: hypothetical protein RLZZ330_400 [Actinomycetota bacterium]|jgi:hypothetical protein
MEHLMRKILIVLMTMALSSIGLLSAKADVVTGVSAYAGIDVATNGKSSVIAFATNSDSDKSTYVKVKRGSKAWSKAVKLIDGDVDMYPQVEMLLDGRAIAVFYINDSLYYSMTSKTGTKFSTPKKLPGSADLVFNWSFDLSAFSNHVMISAAVIKSHSLFAYTWDLQKKWTMNEAGDLFDPELFAHCDYEDFENCWMHNSSFSTVSNKKGQLSLAVTSYQENLTVDPIQVRMVLQTFKRSSAKVEWSAPSVLFTKDLEITEGDGNENGFWINSQVITPKGKIAIAMNQGDVDSGFHASVFVASKFNQDFVESDSETLGDVISSEDAFLIAKGEKIFAGFNTQVDEQSQFVVKYGELGNLENASTAVSGYYLDGLGMVNGKPTMMMGILNWRPANIFTIKLTKANWSEPITAFRSSKANFSLLGYDCYYDYSASGLALGCPSEHGNYESHVVEFKLIK